MITRRARLAAVAVAVGAVTASAAVGSTATAGPESATNDQVIRERLSGFQETPLAISTPGTGSIRLSIDDRQKVISWRLSYTSLEAAITQAHIHFGSQSQSGGIAVFFCSNVTSPTPPPGTPPCPPVPATITGTFTAEDVLNLETNQGLSAGAFDDFVEAIRAGFTYVNVHSQRWPAGEIRGKLGGHH